MSETHFFPATEISFIPFCDGGALFYPKIQRLWALNPLASYIWLSLSDGISKEKLVSDIVDRFSISSQIAEFDLNKILSHFENEGLLGDSHPSQPNIEKETDIFIPDGQLIDSVNYSSSDCCCQIEAYGFTCQIHFPEKKLLNSFRQLYHYFLSEKNESKHQNIFVLHSKEKNDAVDVYLDGKCISKKRHYLKLDSTIHFIFFSQCAKHLSALNKLMFHAASVKKGHKTIVLPANSGSGKTTLSVALTACGWQCITDELAVLDLDDLSITPLPIPMRIRSGSFTPLLPFYPAIPELPVFQDLYENSIRWIVLEKENIVDKLTCSKITELIFPRYTENATTELLLLDKLKALEKLAATGSSERDMTLDDAKAMVRLVEQTPCYELLFSDLHDAIAAIESI